MTREPQRLAKWEAGGLYQRIMKQSAGRPKFVLHDGPPFANGDVHMGTALNKVLKDIIVKSKTMAGHHAPFIPAWDCHGLPIEFKVVKEAKDLAPAEIRTRSEAYARKFIDIQRQSFKRLGIFGDWENPYLTLTPGYEAAIMRTVDRGETWQLLSTIKAKHDLSELCAAELHDQTMVMIARPEGDICWSHDHGRNYSQWRHLPFAPPAQK